MANNDPWIVRPSSQQRARIGKILNRTTLKRSELLRLLMDRGLQGFNWSKYRRRAVTLILFNLLASMLVVGLPARAQTNDWLNGYYFAVPDLTSNGMARVWVAETNGPDYSEPQYKDGIYVITNIVIATNFEGTIQMGTNFYSLRKLTNAGIGNAFIMGDNITLTNCNELDYGDGNQVWYRAKLTPFEGSVLRTILKRSIAQTNAPQQSVPWIGCPAMSSNDPWSGHVGWLPAYQIGLRAGGVMVWKPNVDFNPGH